MKKVYINIFAVTYFIGLGSTIYLIGELINKLLHIHIGPVVMLLIQIVGVYSFIKVQEIIKEDAIEKYKYNNLL